MNFLAQSKNVEFFDVTMPHQTGRSDGSDEDVETDQTRTFRRIRRGRLAGSDEDVQTGARREATVVHMPHRRYNQQQKQTADGE